MATSGRCKKREIRFREHSNTRAYEAECYFGIEKVAIANRPSEGSACRALTRHRLRLLGQRFEQDANAVVCRQFVEMRISSSSIVRHREAPSSWVRLRAHPQAQRKRPRAEGRPRPLACLQSHQCVGAHDRSLGRYLRATKVSKSTLSQELFERLATAGSETQLIRVTGFAFESD